MWKEGIKVEVQTFSQTHIDAIVDNGADVGSWHLTRFYGNPDTAKRHESWAKLKHLKRTTLLWLAIRDFSEIMGLSEKEGGSLRLRQQMDSFNEAINYCGFHDMGYIGPKLMWLYQKSNGEQIRERLDRALVTRVVGCLPKCKIVSPIFLDVKAFTVVAPYDP